MGSSHHLKRRGRTSPMGGVGPFEPGSGHRQFVELDGTDQLHGPDNVKELSGNPEDLPAGQKLL